jgi:hypothetical protein
MPDTHIAVAQEVDQYAVHRTAAAAAKGSSAAESA